MTDLFGGYKSQTTRALQTINSSKYPDTDKDFQKNLQRLNQFVDYIAQYLQTMQKGVDQANEDPITKLRNTVLDMGSLLGGGELLYGINLGDLQYFLPAIAAMFGFDASQPFPLNLLYAAEHFFLGFIIPLDAWAPAVTDIIRGWATALGLSPAFMQAVEDLLNNMGRFTNDLMSLFNDFTGLFGFMNILDPLAGPIGPLWHALTQLLSQFNFTNLGHIVDPFLETLTPWIELLAQILGAVDDMLEGISGGLGGGGGTLLNPQTWISNVMSIFGNPLGLLSGSFNPLSVWTNIIQTLINPLSSILSSNVLSGFISPSLLNILPVGALSSSAPNRVRNSTFTADAIAPSGDWSVDMTSSRTADGSGSALITADGQSHSLRTGENPLDKIAVGPGQSVTTVGYIMHSGAVVGVGGPPILIQVVPFTGTNGETELPAETIADYTPAAPDLAWPGIQLTGKYTVPDNVTFIQGKIDVTPQALLGKYRVDDFDLTHTADMTVIPGLMGVIQGIVDRWHATIDAITSAVRGFPVVGAEIADMITAITSFNPLAILGTLGPSTISGDLTGILQHIFAAAKNQPVDPTTPVSLADVYNAVNQALHNTDGQDVTVFVNTTGSMPIESWVQQLELIPVGKGQDGEDGLVFGLDGQGGQHGQINPTTLLRGTHFDSGVTTLNYTVNSDGSFTFSIPAGTATPARNVTAVAGTGSQSPHFGTGSMGIGVPPLDYNSKSYVAGGNQNTPGANGNSPGGGGAGGKGAFFQKGGKGGAPGGWARKLATPVAGGSTGADVTAPTGGVGTVLSATNSSITVQHSGSVDA